MPIPKPDRNLIYSAAEVMAMFGFKSIEVLKAQVASGDFPEPYQASPQSDPVWFGEDLDDWVRGRRWRARHAVADAPPEKKTGKKSAGKSGEIGRSGGESGGLVGNRGDSADPDEDE